MDPVASLPVLLISPSAYTLAHRKALAPSPYSTNSVPARKRAPLTRCSVSAVSCSRLAGRCVCKGIAHPPSPSPRRGADISSIHCALTAWHVPCQSPFLPISFPLPRRPPDLSSPSTHLTLYVVARTRPPNPHPPRYRTGRSRERHGRGQQESVAYEEGLCPAVPSSSARFSRL